MITAKPLRILLVEDNILVQEALCNLLRSYPNIDLVDVAADGEEAVSKAVELQPTVVVMDIDLPRMDGITATREIKTKYPQIVVIGLTTAREDYLVYAMLKAGASALLAKGNAAHDLYSTIQRAVASSHPIIILEEDQAASAKTPPFDESSALHGNDIGSTAEGKVSIDSEDQS